MMWWYIMLFHMSTWKDEVCPYFAEGIAGMKATGSAFDGKIVAKWYDNCNLSLAAVTPEPFNFQYAQSMLVSKILRTNFALLLVRRSGVFRWPHEFRASSGEIVVHGAQRDRSIVTALKRFTGR